MKRRRGNWLAPTLLTVAVALCLYLFVVFFFTNFVPVAPPQPRIPTPIIVAPTPHR